MQSVSRVIHKFFWNLKLKRELREFQARGQGEAAPTLISPTAVWVPSTDTAHYSVRRYDAVTSRWVYAPWDWLRASEVFACNFIKMSDGLGKDPFGDEHAADMRAAGKPNGTYHFFRPERNAIQQEQVFSEACAAAGGYGFSVAIDCETRPSTVTPQTYMSGLGSFINELSKHYSGQLRIYSRASFWDSLWLNAGSPAFTRAIPQWQAVYPTALQTDEAIHAILYEGWVPSFPAYEMKGLGPREGWQLTPSIKNLMIPGHNMVKAVEDGNLWLRVTIPTSSTPPPMTYEQKVDEMWRLHYPNLH